MIMLVRWKTAIRVIRAAQAWRISDLGELPDSMLTLNEHWRRVDELGDAVDAYNNRKEAK